MTQAKSTPTVTVTPSASSITTAQTLSVTVRGAATPTPTGSVTLTGGRLHLGGYNPEQRQRHDQRPRRIAEHGHRHTDGQLHSGLQQLLDLQQRHRHQLRHGDHSGQDHADSRR